jgi:hypothetical protein
MGVRMSMALLVELRLWHHLPSHRWSLPPPHVRILRRSRMLDWADNDFLFFLEHAGELRIIILSREKV